MKYSNHDFPWDHVSMGSTAFKLLCIKSMYTWKLESILYGFSYQLFNRRRLWQYKSLRTDDGQALQLNLVTSKFVAFRLVPGLYMKVLVEAILTMNPASCSSFIKPTQYWENWVSFSKRFGSESNTSQRMEYSISAWGFYNGKPFQIRNIRSSFSTLL